MTGKLKNRTRFSHTYNLSLKVAPLRKIYERQGSNGVENRRIVLPDSVTVLAGVGTLSPSLPDGAKDCPEVAAAIKRRDVIWVPDPVEAPSAAPNEEAPKLAPEPEPTTINDGEPNARRRARG